MNKSIKQSDRHLCTFSLNLLSATPPSLCIHMAKFTRYISVFSLQISRPYSGAKSTSSYLLSTDQSTIVCVHPKCDPPLGLSKPLKMSKPVIKRESLTQEQTNIVKRLRSQDPSVWTVNTLARLFNVRRADISNVVPTNQERVHHLEKEREILSSLPVRKRRIYVTKKEAERQKKLEEYISKMNYDFPGLAKK